MDESKTSQLSEMGRILARKRWGPQRVIKLAAMIRERVDELPDVERKRLIEALRDAEKEDWRERWRRHLAFLESTNPPDIAVKVDDESQADQKIGH